MTTTQTPCFNHPHETAIWAITASHFDPDRDEDGYVPGWSRAVTTKLCDSCYLDYQDDELVDIVEANPL